jgi:phage-related protein
MSFQRRPSLAPTTDLPLKAQRACRAKLQLLAVRGHELDRPAAAYLGDGIYELRFKVERLQYRALYFFHGRTAVVLSHGFLKKQSVVPPIEIERALRRKSVHVADPQRHTASGRVPT